MSEPLTDEEIIAILKQGFPLPPQERIDALLERCLEILRQASDEDDCENDFDAIDSGDEVECRELSDEELELAAAGDAYSYLSKNDAAGLIR